MSPLPNPISHHLRVSLGDLPGKFALYDHPVGCARRICVPPYCCLFEPFRDFGIVHTTIVQHDERDKAKVVMSVDITLFEIGLGMVRGAFRLMVFAQNTLGSRPINLLEAAMPA